MQSLLFLSCFFFKSYRRKTFRGVGSTSPPLVKEGLKQIEMACEIKKDVKPNIELGCMHSIINETLTNLIAYLSTTDVK